MSDLDFEFRLANALRAPVRASENARDDIMRRVRAEKSAEGDSRAGFLRRAARHSLVGAALAAGIGSSAILPSLRAHTAQVNTAAAVTSIVIGDSVVDRLRDTMRLVRLMFNDSAARSVAVAGDFNDWSSEATPLTRDDRTGRWSVTLALHDGAHRYAILVDNTRTYAVLNVAPASN